MTADTIMHALELGVVVIIAPGIKQLVSVLVKLQQTMLLMNQTLNTHQVAFQEHTQQDQVHFSILDKSVSQVSGDVREMMGMMGRRGRTGGDRRGNSDD